MRRIEIGQGVRPHEGYETVDVDPATKPIHLADVRCLPFEDDSVDEVLMVHSLEHMFWADILWVLGEINRVLRPGGFVRIEVPDFERVKNGGIQNLFNMYDMIYMDKAGDRRAVMYNSDKLFDDDFKEGFCHLSCFDEGILSWFLDCTGFDSRRDRSWEAASPHNWNPVLCMVGTKRRKPKPSSEINNKIITRMHGYKWVDKYVERYG